eukprot:CAMPEP_0194526940 /NCGR_PEP_ID=MMETSP0253-20130528/62887_1 /TAXON_ID=2966 /ORGANISM="Noctiluca scintillans" /LENGTH=59 /DNA_ID=CAMNT_0039371807 /DNA_START=256 /DNA_END=431 /DNA_ORIENTATION=-
MATILNLASHARDEEDRGSFHHHQIQKLQLDIGDMRSRIHSEGGRPNTSRARVGGGHCG